MFQIALALGIVVFCIVAVLFLVVLPGSPKEIKVSLKREIEEKAKSEGMDILSEKKFLENKFVNHVSFGGAGGLGSARAGALDEKDFIKTAKEIGAKWIFYAFSEVDRKLVKKYWTSTAEGVMIEYSDVYSSDSKEETRAEYSVKGYDENEVVFKRDIFGSVVRAFLAGFVLGLAVTCISMMIELLLSAIF